MTNLQQAMKYFERGKITEAIHLYLKVLDKDPNEALAYQGLAECYYEKGSLGDAYEAGLKALQINNELPVPHIIIGSIFLAENKLDDAEKSIRQALTLDTHQINAHYALSLLLLRRGLIKESISFMRNVVDLNNKSWKAHYYFGSLLRNQQFHREASREYHLAYKYHPSFHVGYFLLIENIYINRVLYAIIMGMSLIMAYLIHTIYALPLVLLSSSYLFLLGFIWLREKNYQKSLLDFGLGLFNIIGFIWYFLK